MKRLSKGMAKRFWQHEHFGPGGMYCPCCSDFRTGRGARKNKEIGRRIRRVERMETKRKLAECQ